MATFFWTNDIEHYVFSDLHPLRPLRWQLLIELLERYGVFERMPIQTPRPASVEELLLVHTPGYVDAVKALSSGASMSQEEMYEYGFSTSGDNPPFRGMWEASLAYTGATVCAAEAVLDGESVAFNFGGGLHHALPSRASGFCIFADPAIAIQIVRRKFKKVVYLDIDLHHGDGTQWIFYEDPDVLTVSIHESGQYLFPGTGFVTEIGEGAGRGTSVNIPLAPGTPDEVWWWAFSEIVLLAFEQFQPEAIVFQMGADPHYLDPLGHLQLTAQGWLRAVEWVQSLGLPIVALGGGGYEMTTVPRMWTLATATLTGIELPNETPADFSWHEEIPTLRDAIAPSYDSVNASFVQQYAEEGVVWLKQHLYSDRQRR
jgi:acetoin utilization protein AcuC